MFTALAIAIDNPQSSGQNTHSSKAQVMTRHPSERQWKGRKEKNETSPQPVPQEEIK